MLSEGQPQHAGKMDNQREKNTENEMRTGRLYELLSIVGLTKGPLRVDIGVSLVTESSPELH